MSAESDAAMRRLLDRIARANVLDQLDADAAGLVEPVVRTFEGDLEALADHLIGRAATMCGHHGRILRDEAVTPLRSLAADWRAAVAALYAVETGKRPPLPVPNHTPRLLGALEDMLAAFDTGDLEPTRNAALEAAREAIAAAKGEPAKAAADDGGAS